MGAIELQKKEKSTSDSLELMFAQCESMLWWLAVGHGLFRPLCLHRSAWIVAGMLSRLQYLDSRTNITSRLVYHVTLTPYARSTHRQLQRAEAARALAAWLATPPTAPAIHRYSILSDP